MRASLHALRIPLYVAVGGAAFAAASWVNRPDAAHVRHDDLPNALLPAAAVPAVTTDGIADGVRAATAPDAFAPWRGALDGERREPEPHLKGPRVQLGLPQDLAPVNDVPPHDPTHGPTA